LEWSRIGSYAGDDQPAGISLDSSGVYVLEAYPNDHSWGDGRFAVVKFDLSGGPLWSRTVGGSAQGGSWPVAGEIRADANGVYLCGYRVDQSLNAAGYLAFLSRVGDMVWEKTYDGGGDARFLGLDQDSTGNLTVAGAVGSLAADRWDLRTLSFDSASGLRWTKTRDFGESSETGRAAAGGPIYIAGSAGSGAVLLKYAEAVGPTAALSSSPAPLLVRRSASAVLRVTNAGGAGLTGVVPALAVTSGTLFVAVGSPPSPALADLPAGGTVSFTWTLSVTGVGSALLSATATGRIADNGDVVTSAAAAAVTSVRAIPDFKEAMIAFPNPVTGDVLNVALKLAVDAAEIDVELFDMAYRRIYRGTRHNVANADGLVTVNGMNKLAPGVYLLRAKARLIDGAVTRYDAIKVVVK
jgi:hypothetical protein